MKKLSIRNTFVIIGLILSCLLQSCNKLIDIPSSPPTKITSFQVFADSASTMGAVAGVYNNFGLTSFASTSIGSGLITEITGLSADELIGSGYIGSLRYYSNNLLSNDGYCGQLWGDAYTNIYQMNACLEGIAGSNSLSVSLKDQLAGELEVVRSFYYFNMINVWGGVPLVTTSDFHTTENLPRAVVADIYSRMVADLSDAMSRLKADYPSSGRHRPNLYTAAALLAKVYLYQGQWQKAADLASQVIGSGLYQLTPDLNQVFLDGSGEAIWQLPAVGQSNQTKEAVDFIPYDPTIVPDYSLSPYLLNAFEPNDKRRYSWLDSNVVTDNGFTEVYYYPYKYKNVSSSASPAEAYMMLRLGELYLIRAEASAELKDLTTAVADLNVVRQRAGLANTMAQTDTEVLAAIMHERQVELFCEWGNRWFDLKRTGTIDAVLGAEKSWWKPYAALYPIPVSEVQLNSFLVQNTGY